MPEPRGQQRFHVTPQHRRLHHHRIPAGEQHASHFPVSPQIALPAVPLAAGELQLVDADELRPAEAVGAVGVAGLTRRREEQHRLTVLVLDTRYRLAVQQRHVQLQLPGGMRVQRVLDLPSRRRDLLLRRAATNQPVHPAELLGGQHLRLREGQLEDWILWDGGPIDQLVNDVLVHSER